MADLGAALSIKTGHVHVLDRGSGQDVHLTSGRREVA